LIAVKLDAFSKRIVSIFAPSRLLRDERVGGHHVGPAADACCNALSGARTIADARHASSAAFPRDVAIIATCDGEGGRTIWGLSPLNDEAFVALDCEGPEKDVTLSYTV